ncbi:MAG: hypothetical protein R3B49_02045 [Phycisphaerales bacterium]
MPSGSALSAPMMRSSTPSPLTSPAPETDTPAKSEAFTPRMANPADPSPPPAGRSSASSSSGGNPVSRPKTTYVTPGAEMGASSARGAPMSRSSMPSALTSPARATAYPV